MWCRMAICHQFVIRSLRAIYVHDRKLFVNSQRSRAAELNGIFVITQGWTKMLKNVNFIAIHNQMWTYGQVAKLKL